MTNEIVIGGDAEDIPPGSYPGTLTALTEKHSDKFDSDFRVWTFTLDTGSVVEGSSSMNTGSKSKGGRWIAALLGRVPAKGDKVSPIGSRAIISVILGEDGWPKVGEVIAEPKTAKPAKAETTDELDF